MNKMFYLKNLYLVAALILFIDVIGVHAQVSSKAKTQKEVISQAIDLVSSDLKKQGLAKLKELVAMSKKKDKRIVGHLASRGVQLNPNNPDDKIEYATALDADIDEELLNDYFTFFNAIDKDCGKRKKVMIMDTSSENEPIGFAFRMTIPGKIAKGNVACYHYTIGFRRTFDNKLLVTEWYEMPGNYNCQK